VKRTGASQRHRDRGLL